LILGAHYQVQRYGHIKNSHLPALLSTLVAVANGRASSPNFPVKGNLSLTGERSFALVHQTQFGYGKQQDDAMDVENDRGNHVGHVAEENLFEKVMRMHHPHASRHLIPGARPARFNPQKINLGMYSDFLLR
jgi:hypothetical protein